MNKAGYTPVMLAALTAAESPDDLEVAQQLLKQGDVNARSRQVLLKRARECPTLVTVNTTRCKFCPLPLSISLSTDPKELAQSKESRK